MHVLLTGGSGFLGRHLIARLTGDGHTVHALARSDSAAETVRGCGAQPVPGDLTDLTWQNRAGWLNVLGAVDAVLHAGGFMDFWGTDDLFVVRNLTPTKALYTAAVAAGVGRFVFVSAAGVTTGTNRASVVDEDSHPGRAYSAYARVKLRTERELLALPRGDTILVIIRPPYIWGEGMTQTLQPLVDAAESGSFRWIDRGEHIVDTCHVDNLAHATALTLVRGGHGLVCHVTDGDPRPARAFFTAFIATRGVDISRAGSIAYRLAWPVATALEFGAKALRRRTPPTLTRWTVAVMGRDRSYDVTRARTVLGYRPVVTVDDGLSRLAAAGRPAVLSPPDA